MTRAEYSRAEVIAMAKQIKRSGLRTWQEALRMAYHIEARRIANATPPNISSIAINQGQTIAHS